MNPSDFAAYEKLRSAVWDVVARTEGTGPVVEELFRNFVIEFPKSEVDQAFEKAKDNYAKQRETAARWEALSNEQRENIKKHVPFLVFP